MTHATTPAFKAPVPHEPGRAAKVTVKTAVKDIAAAAKDPAVITEGLSEGDGHDEVDDFKAEGAGHYRRFGWLRLDEMEIDERVQRPEVPAEVNKIAREFNEQALGTAVVSARVNPVTGATQWIVLDGRQRRAGALKAGFDGKIRVDVHYNLTLADVARLFRILNERKAVQPIQLFKNALIEQDEHALAVQKILDDLGIPFGTAKGYSGAKSSVRLVARRNGATILRWALTQVQKIYDAERDGGCYDASVVEAFYWLYDHHGSRIDEENLYKKLVSLEGGTAGLVGHAKNIKSFRGGRLSVNLIRAIIARYNHDKRSAKTKLPDWTQDVTEIVED